MELCRVIRSFSTRLKAAWIAWIQGLQFDAGVVGREAPIHGDSQLVAPFLPGGGLRAQRLRVRDPFGQGLACEGIDFREPCGRGNIEPGRGTTHARMRRDFRPRASHCRIQRRTVAAHTSRCTARRGAVQPCRPTPDGTRCAGRGGLIALVQDTGFLCVLRLSQTKVIRCACGKCTSTRSQTKVQDLGAKSSLVRRAVTSTRRQPSKGAVIMNRLAVPTRRYS